MSRPDAPRNQLGVASVILGGLALATCWLLIGVPLGVVAVLTGDIAKRRVSRGEANNPRVAIAGMIACAAAVVLVNRRARGPDLDANKSLAAK